MWIPNTCGKFDGNSFFFGTNGGVGEQNSTYFFSVLNFFKVKVDQSIYINASL